MKSIINYLDDCKRKTGSDNKTAKELEIERTTIANIRKRGQMADETAIKIALLLEKDPSELLIAAAIARSEGTTKIEWEKISQRAGFIAGIIMPASLALSTFGDILKAAANTAFCILCKIVDNRNFAKMSRFGMIPNVRLLHAQKRSRINQSRGRRTLRSIATNNKKMGLKQQTA